MSDRQDDKRSTKISWADESQPNSLTIDEKLALIMSDLKIASADNEDVSKKRRELAAIDLCTDVVTGILDHLKRLDLRITGIEREVREVKATCTRRIEAVEAQIQDDQEHANRNSLVVLGVPEHSNENILDVLEKLAKVIHFPDWSSDLVDVVHRVGSRYSYGYGRPMSLRFVSRLDRNTFLMCRRKKSNVRASDLGFDSHNTVFVNECLTLACRRLLQKAKDIAQEKGYEYVWTYNNSVFMKKAHGTTTWKIQNEEDLENL